MKNKEIKLTEIKKHNPSISDILDVMNKTKPYDKITLGSNEPKVGK